MSTTEKVDAAEPELTTDVAIVGGGPGGVLLAYLLARAGVRVDLLEAHRDFDRDFRGDSLHPYTLELLDRLGLADDLLKLEHFAATRFRMHTPAGTLVTADYGRIHSKFNYIALMPQARFLDFLAGRAAALPSFTLRTGARVRRLLTDADQEPVGRSGDGLPGTVTGVAWKDDAGEHRLRARLVVAADGRFSRLRTLAGVPVTDLGAASDLLWFRLPRRPEDPPEADVDLYFGTHHYVGLLGGDDTWQIGYSLPKGGFAAAREAGVEPIRAFLREHVAWLGDRIDQLTDFGQTTLLSVELLRAERWHQPGLLLIGDAAHVISPVGGNGILMAIQDAVAATNRLVPVLTGHGGAPVPEVVPEAVLAAIQADREAAIVEVQDDQAKVERRAKEAREAGRPLIPGRLLKVVTAIPGVRARSARSNAYGPNPPVLASGLLAGDGNEDAAKPLPVR
ncbi:2-polyprenyl-6-methoxyphenol hydroxylase-like FAD-dependent oxidoreductase [Friedmanniella endophytica]|uniref:2-polyprenyl-6-methoxyphenol hydroxylase-like FAD-dependent oxidoreductase n=1 Tax=Microlunatus kandeliicorticis TaxID=1759536 RepID=A0A7W3P6V5_9ACTN|nr:FAD-dependent oxidoreductase [Microlunatus kandeliicorticis]MBA8795373.1 2-polyprenyl-6-methoxyphenol hydroxylase-like FAD-dependent oxidoreductase [Microlunatus kandeliicorticis]